MPLLTCCGMACPPSIIACPLAEMAQLGNCINTSPQMSIKGFGEKNHQNTIPKSHDHSKGCTLRLILLDNYSLVARRNLYHLVGRCTACIWFLLLSDLCARGRALMMALIRCQGPDRSGCAKQEAEGASHRISCGPFNFGMNAAAASSGRQDPADAAGLKSRGRRLAGCFGAEEEEEAGLAHEQRKYSKARSADPCLPCCK